MFLLRVIVASIIGAIIGALIGLVLDRVTEWYDDYRLRRQIKKYHDQTIEVLIS